MKCSKCGAELEENAKFCPKCGMAASTQPNENVIQKEQGNGASAKKPLMKHPGFIFLAIAVVLVIILGLLFKGRGWRTVILLMVARHPQILFFIMVLMIAAVVIAVYLSILHKRRRKGSQEIAQYVLADSDINKFSQYFVNRDETYISSLGNGYLMNFLASGTIGRGFAVISNKRVYFRGSCFSGSGKSLVKTDEERTVDIKDITGSGFLYRRYIGILLALFTALIALFAGIATTFYRAQELWHTVAVNTNNMYYDEQEMAYIESHINELDEYIRELEMQGNGDSELASQARRKRDFEINNLNSFQRSQSEREDEMNDAKEAAPTWTALAGLLLTFLISCFVIFLDYLRKRKTLFQIQYAGGSIAFDVSYYAKAEIDDFQKQLRRIKDLAAESAEKITVAASSHQAAVQSSAPTSVPDDLRKYAELLKDGLISQEEYDAVKKKTLGL